MNNQVIYLGMAEIMRRIAVVQTNAERLTSTVPNEEMLEMLLDIETSAAWLREKFATKLTEEERAAYATFRHEHRSDKL